MATLSERYRVHNKKKSNKSLLVYIFIFAIFIFSTSFSRYKTEWNILLGIGLANFQIKINDVRITQSTQTLEDEIELVVSENNDNSGLVKPGQKGYFDIVIDPQYTEVSLQYTITLDTSYLPNEIQLTSYSINDLTQKITMPNNKTFIGEILLDGDTSLDSTDIKHYRVYWEWPEENAKMESVSNNYKVVANVQIEQIV